MWKAVLENCKYSYCRMVSYSSPKRMFHTKVKFCSTKKVVTGAMPKGN